MWGLLFAAVHAVGFVGMWVIVGKGLHDIYRRHRLGDEQSAHLMRVDMADVNGLTEMQIHVALDAAMTAFSQRVYEMQQHNNGRGEQ